MPTKYAKKPRTYRKKRYTKKAKKNYSRMPFRRQTLVTSGFPKTTAVRLRYVDSIQLTFPSADVLGQHYFRCNSGFAPDVTGSATAHQPMGWDEWSQFYRNYVVIGSKIKVTGSSLNTDASVMALQPVPSTTGTTDVTQFLEQSRTRRTTFKSSSNNPKQKALTASYSTKKFFNITNVLDNIDDLGASVSASPTKQAYYCLSFGSLDPADAGGNTSYLLVEMEFIIIFSNPKPLGQS